MKRVLCLVALLATFIGMAANGVNEEFDVNEASSNPTVSTSNYSFPSAVTAALYSNGPLVNGVGTGAGGLDESILQGNLGMTTLGAGHQVGFGNRIADDFTIVGPDWNITNITFYAYQTGETASTITAVNMRIWDGVPGAMGSNIIFGDDTTNRMVSTVNSNILRVTETTTGTATNRQIAASDVAVNITLPAGTYWLDWQSDGSGGSGPWAPPITITGQTSTGNAMQFTGAWADLTDGGTLTPQGLPFVVQGTSAVVLVPPTPVPAINWIGLALLLMMLAFVSRRFLIKQ
jgi:hypothetical protein